MLAFYLCLFSWVLGMMERHPSHFLSLPISSRSWVRWKWMVSANHKHQGMWRRRITDVTGARVEAGRPVRILFKWEKRACRRGLHIWNMEQIGPTSILITEWGQKALKMTSRVLFWVKGQWWCHVLKCRKLREEWFWVRRNRVLIWTCWVRAAQMQLGIQTYISLRWLYIQVWSSERFVQRIQLWF